ncbi:MAG: class II aldolase/adducin family protein [Candidatus Bathyarchaeia archaeon]
MEAELRDKIVEVSRRLYLRGLVAGAGGNVSAAIRDEGVVLITPSGLCKGYLKPEDIVKVDFSGRVLEGALKPTSELSSHLGIYRVRGDVNAIVHAHPPVSTGFACAGSPMDYTVYPEIIAMIGEIRFVGYETPTTRELAEKIAENIRGVEALLLENHGIITVGSNLEQAYQRAELLEDFAKITLVAKLLGGPKRLPDAEVRKIMGLESEKYRLRLAKSQRKGD